MIITAPSSTAPSFNNEAAESKSEVYGQELAERGMNRLQDVSKNSANFSFTNQSLGAFRQIFNMRGLVNSSIYGAPAVVFYVDDVAYSSAMTNMGMLFDIDSVAVYRGSQPASFGKNAYAGAVDIHTSQPDNTLKGGAALELSEYEGYLATAKSSGAIIKDKLFFNLSGVYNQRDGFLTNTFLNNRPDGQENFSGKAALTWKPTTNLDVRLTLLKDDFNYGNARFTRLDNPVRFTTAADLHEQLKQTSDNQALRMAYQTENYNLLSVSSHRFWQNKPFLIDLDLNPAPIAMRSLNLKNETWTQELRLAPKTKGEWDWHVGGFYSTTHYNEDDNLAVPGSHNLYFTVIDTDNYAVLGHLAYQGFSKLNVYTDLRIDYVHSAINSSLQSLIPAAPNLYLNGNYDTVFASPKWGIDYRLSEQSVVYASTGFGFKPGGFTYANADTRAERYAQETLWHNSVGFKTSWFDERLKTNIAAFYYQMHNYQVERFFAGGNYSLFNAPRVSSYGFELENQAQLIRNVYLESNVGYTHSHFDSYYDKAEGIDYTGNPVPFVPEFNASTALQYKHPHGYFARAEWLWKGKTYFNETRDDTLSQNSYSTLNLRVGYAKGRYSAYLFANNVTDSYYYTTKLGVRGAPADPRVIGVRLGVDF